MEGTEAPTSVSKFVLVHTLSHLNVFFLQGYRRLKTY